MEERTEHFWYHHHLSGGCVCTFPIRVIATILLSLNNCATIQARVFKATDQITGQVVAVKKSRVPLRFKRTVIQHEARVLQMLCGHPTIPLVCAVERFEHFEYLSMELLGPNIRAIVEKAEAVRKRIAPRLAVQMLSALKHVHSHGIIHGDIKLDNILLCPTDHHRIRLINFGITHQYLGQPAPIIGPGKEPDCVLGTL
ncbi:kinase-like domain-containing protein [Suillus paluster]|uniref:kinase-like domain-containing protein n=1 Tax=Suillus paluster TaxID=48578 RepID=UPI001B87B508|nr:kinase-like domain-containing protein [Suillus paluster]KAG1741569.1 kinase-like domain-containing protein [Suillus paluster]